MNMPDLVFLNKENEAILHAAAAQAGKELPEARKPLTYGEAKAIAEGKTTPTD